MADRFDELFGAQPTGPSSSDRFEDLFGPGPETRPIEGFGYGKTPGFEEDLGRKELEDPEFARQVARTRKIDPAPEAPPPPPPVDPRRLAGGGASFAKIDQEQTAGDDTTYGETARSFLGGLVTSGGSTLSGMAEGSDAITRTLRRLSEKVGAEKAFDYLMAPAEWTGITKKTQAVGESIENVGDQINVPDDRRDTVSNVVSNALGQVTGQIAIAWGGGASAASTAYLGQSFDQMADAFRANGKEGTAGADAATILAAPVMGMTEKLGIDKILERVPPSVRNRFMRGLTDVAIAGGIEAAQEVAEQFVQNLAVKLGGVEDQSLTEGFDQSAIGGGGAGAILRGLLGKWGGHAPRRPNVLDGEQSGAPVAPGIRESGALNVDITPEDEASPLPTELIAGGKMEMGAATATNDANRILGAAGMPNVGTRVAVTHNGKTKSGAVADAYEVTVNGATSPGVKIRLDDGTMIEEPVATLSDIGVTVAPLPELPEGDLADPVVQQFAAMGAANVAEANQQPISGQLADTPNLTPSVQSPSSGGSVARDVLKAKIRGVESSGNDNAKNPNSSASGRYQFTDGTWKALGGDPAKKNDPAEQERLMDKLTDQNQRRLEKAGLQTTAGNLYLAHFLGAGGAVNALKNPNAKVDAKVAAANPFAEGWTNGQLAAWANRKMGGKAGEWTSNPNTAADRHFAQQDRKADSEDLALSEDSVAQEEQPDLFASEQPTEEGYVPFPEDSGTLGIPRAEMPQIKAEHRGAMVNYLNARGIQHEEATVPAAELLATQKEYSPAKVQQAKDFTGGDRAVLVSEDGYIVDGHHQALAKAEDGDRIRVIRLKAPIQEVLDTLKGMPSATTEAVASGLQDQVNAAGFGDKVEVIPVTGKQKADSGFHRSFLGSEGIDPKSGRQDTPEGARARFEAGYDHFFEVHGKKLQVKPKGGKFVASYEHSEYQPTEFDTREQAVEWLLDRAVYPNQVMEALGRREPVQPNKRSEDLPPPLSKQDAMKAKMQEKAKGDDGLTEHPGLVLKSLQTGETTRIQPHGTKPPATEGIVGDPFEAGKAAFRAGEQRVAPGVANGIPRSQERQKEWYRGWDAANLAAPVEDKPEPPKQAAMKAKMQGKGSKAEKEAEREAERKRAEEQSARIRAENEARDKAKIAEWAGTDFTQPGAPLPDWNDRRVVLAKWTVGEPDYGRQRKPGESFDSGDVQGELKAMLENEGLAATWSQSIVYRLEPTDKGWTVYVNHDMSQPNAHTFFVGQGLTREQAIERIFADPEVVFHIGVSDGRQKAFDLRILKDPEGRFYYRSDYNSQNGGGSGPSKGDWYYGDRFDTLEAAKADAIDAMWNRWRRIAERAEDSGDNKKDLTTWKKVQAVLLQHMPDGKRDPALDKADLQRELDRDISSFSWQLFGNHHTPLPRNALNIDFESMPWRNAWEVGEKPAKPSWMTYGDPPTAAGYQRAARRTYDRFVKQYGEEPKLPEKLEKPKPEPTDKRPVQSWFDYVNDPANKDAIPLRASDMRGETTPTAPKSEEAPADDGTFNAAPEMVQVFYGIWSTKAEADRDAESARKTLGEGERAFVEQQPNGWAVYIEKPKADPSKTVNVPKMPAPEGAVRDVVPNPRNARSILVRFASGMSRIGDLKAGTRALGGSDKMGVGVDVGELSANGVQEIAAAVVNWGGRVFVDSGAFSLFKKNIREGAEATPLDFDQILRRYDSIIENVAELDEAESVPELGEPHLLFVMPDIVGDQAGSLALVDRYATWISTQARSDVIKPIVPLQIGELSLADAYRQVVDRLGNSDFIVGIPSNERAVSTAEFKEFVEAAKPTRLHFLGAAHERTLGSKLTVLQQVLDANPGYRLDHVSADANILRSALYGRDSDLGDATRSEKVQGTLEARDLAAGSVNNRYNEGYGSKNKLVTRDRAEAIREKLRAKLRNQVNSGIDPEVLAMGTELAVFHIEAGARKFADFAKALSEDLGMSLGQLKRYLRGWYLGAQAMIEDHGEDVSDMDGPGAVRAALSMIEDSDTRNDNADSGNPDGSAAGAESPGVQPAQPDERARSLDEGQSGGSQQDLRSTDREGGQAAERSGEGPGAQSERGGAGTRSGDGRPAARNTGPTNYVIREGALEEARGPKQKARDNVQAIRIVKTLEREQRHATPEEQDALAKYVGWGGLKNVFPDGDGAFGKGFEDIGRELQQLLTPDEYATARRSIQYAHFTAEKVVRAMWSAVQRMGFKSGVVFEPGMGTGNFPGMMPKDVRADYLGVEMDGVTAAIAKALYPLYGVVQADYTQHETGKNAFTLAIGNPPFSETVIKADPAYRSLGLVIHDYFFAKTLDAVKPGGLLAFVTSTGTMNKIDRTARDYLAERAWLAGAVRLPGGAFAENAGTEVTTDIIFLRKKVEGEARPDWAADDNWVETSRVTLPNKDGGTTAGDMSRYFADHPEMVLGEQGFFDRLWPGRMEVRTDGRDLAKALAEALDRLPQGILQSTTLAEQHLATADFNVEEAKNGSYYLKDGKLYQKQGGIGREVETKGKGSKGGLSEKDQAVVRDLIPIRDQLRNVYDADLAIAQGKAEPGSAEAARKALNAAYDAFTKKHGPINHAVFTRRRPNRVQIESARRKAREEARAQGHEWDDGSFDPSELYDSGSSVAEVARVRAEMKEAYAASGQEWSDGTFSDEEVPDTVLEKRPHIDPFKEDPESYRLRSIEHYDDETGTAKKGRVFFESVIAREEEPDIKNATDALFHVLNQAGRVDLDEIARLAKTSPADAATELAGQIFLDPETGQWEHSVRYLSGNVRHKLAVAQAKAADDSHYRANVDALQAAMPPELGKNDVAARLGMSWIPSSDIQAFGESLGLSPFAVTYEPRSAIWAVSGDRHSAAATSTWGTDRRSAVELIRDGLSGATPKIYDTWRDQDGEHRVFNAEATQAATDKLVAIKERFQEWIYSDEARTERLLRLYNERFNSHVAPEYDGSYLTTPGVTADWSWRPHQKRAIARIVQDGNMYLAHAVGAGKTASMIAAAMEMRRLGLVNKPMIAVPNHMLGQFTKEFYELYPLAKLMVADEEAFHTDKRKQFVSDAALNDIDAVIITHSAFGLIPMSESFEKDFIQEQIDELRDILSSVDKSERTTRRKIEQQVEALEQRLRGVTTRRRDQTFTFEQMGVDFLQVDEAHLFRKLDFATRMGEIKGIDPNGSMRSMDLFIKSRYLEQRRPGRSLVLASGTPITNTMAELYTVSRYLQPAALAERGIGQFDAWANAFGDTVTDLEPTAGGTYKPQTRFAQFVNTPELSVMVRQVMDVVTSSQLEQYVVRPKVHRELLNIPQTQGQKTYQAILAARMEAIERRTGKPQKGDDIILTVIGDGRKSAIDMRLVSPDADREATKLEALIDNVFKTWKETANHPFYAITPNGYSAEPASHGPATQMIFSSLGVSDRMTFNVHRYIRAELIKRGVPADQVVLFNQVKSTVAKQKVFNDMNTGKVRVLIGSADKMATGVNAQKKLYANHNLDPEWLPSTDEQRNGRIIRQGNTNREIRIYDYATKGTYDSQMWGIMARKAKFIEGFFRGDPTLRTIEDLGEASTYEQAKALTTKDPRILELTEAKQDLEKELRRRSAHESEQETLAYRARRAKALADSTEASLVLQKKDAAAVEDIKGDAFTATLKGKTYTDRGEFQEALDALMDADTLRRGFNGVGHIGGFELALRVQEAERMTFGKDGTVDKSLQVEPMLMLASDPEAREARFVSVSKTNTAVSVQAALMKLAAKPADTQEYIDHLRKEQAEFEQRAKEVTAYPGEPKIAELQATVTRIEAALKADHDREQAAKQPQQPQQPQAQKAPPRQTVEIGRRDVDEIRTRLLKRMAETGIDDRVSLEVGYGLRLAGEGWQAQYDNWLKLISVSLETSRDPWHSLNHEGFHAIGPDGLRLISPAEYDAVVEAAWESTRLRTWVQKHYADETLDVQRDEAAAEHFADLCDVVAGRAIEGRPLGRVEGLLYRAAFRVARFLRALQHAVSYLRTGQPSPLTAFDVVARFNRGTIGRRNPPSTVRGRPITVTFGKKKPQAGYHGTPHDFDEFSTDHIGTGEGAQAYGWGLYFASSKAVAEHYRDALTRTKLHKVTFNGKTIGELGENGGKALTEEQWDMLTALADVEHSGDVKASIGALRGRALTRFLVGDGDHYRQAADWLERNGKGIKVERPGRLFEVDLPETDELMDWDKPFREQPVRVKAALHGLPEVSPYTVGENEDGTYSVLFQGKANEILRPYSTRERAQQIVDSFNVDWQKQDYPRGRDIYQLLAMRLADTSNDLDEGNGWQVATPTYRADDRAASRLLNELGIPGHRYLDGMSRAKGDGAHNYVIYDQARVRVTAKAQAAPPAAPRSHGLSREAGTPLSAFGNAKDVETSLKAHPRYTAAKGGDTMAAIELVRDLVPREMLLEARKRWPGATFIPALAEERSGRNKIPLALAGALAEVSGGHLDTGIIQTNKAFHTGAKAMDRLVSRPEFAGTVERGTRYVIVDDVTVLGGTLAELANHIQANGGEVVGSALLVNAARNPVLGGDKLRSKAVERRFGNVIREELGIEPAALTGPESFYLLGFKDADSLRARIAKARDEHGGGRGPASVQGETAALDDYIEARDRLDGDPDLEPETIEDNGDAEEEGADLFDPGRPRGQAAPPPGGVEFEPAIEQRWKDASKGIGDGSSLLQRFKLGAGHVASLFARAYHHLPNVPKYADLQQQLRKLQAAPSAAKERAVRILSQITDGFTREDLDLFTRKIVTDDLAWEAEQEHDLPFGFTPETLADARREIETALEQKPNVRDAVRRRKALTREVVQELVDSGVFEAERLKNPNYYRHVVLDYARAQVAAAKTPGVKKKLRTPAWAKRMGSTRDINANYLEAEFDWLLKALVDIPTSRAITWVGESEHNILPELRATAKAQNKARLQAMIQHEKDTLGVGDGPLQEMEKGFRQRIAMGFKFVEDAIDTTHLDVPPQLQASMDAVGGTGSGDPFPFLSWLLDNNHPGANGAAVILKAISQRRVWEQQVLGRHYVDPFDADDLLKKLAPDGYATWSPDEGRLLFTVKTLPQHAIDEMLRKVDSAPGMSSDALRAMLEQTRKALAFGGMRHAMILPEEVAAQLNEIRRDDFHGLIDTLMAWPLAQWKRWVLINPRRVIKYNLNNLSGDLDAIIAGNPKALKHIGRAGRELAQVMRGTAQPSARYEEAVERGVFDSGLSIQEIPDINRLSAFESLTQGSSLRPDKVARKVLAKAWRALQGSTQWRENVLRYAAYLDYVERLEAGESQRSIGYGASLPRMVNAVTDTRDRAALLARDLVGDYGAISEAGSQIRRKLIPFWSWMEINTRRYWRLSSNIVLTAGTGDFQNAAGMTGRMAAVGAWKAAKLSVRMAMFYGLVTLWNHLLFGDDEDELSDEQKAQLHLILGRTDDGQIRTLRIQGALSDALSWFGIGDAAKAVRDYELGRGPWYDVLFAPPKATVNKLVTSVTPLLSQPYEAISGTKLWPDIFATRFIRDRWRNFMSTFSLENEYDLLLDKPSRGYLSSWLQSVTYSRDPGEIAYGEARGLAYDWLKREKGQEGGLFRSDRADALYEWRAARRFEDRDAEQKALQRLIELGVDDKDLNASIKRAHPLGPIAKKDRKRFLDSLTDEELTTFERAETWYRQRFLGEES